MTELALPDFLVLGTQKGGTTTLHKLLTKHPQIYLPSCKEVQYFSLHNDKSREWYSEYFKDAKPGQLKGEITPYYLFHPKAASRIHTLIPNSKLIALLRNPVERTISQVFHAKRHGFEDLGIEAALNAEEQRMKTSGSYSHQKHSYIARSKYVEQLEKYELLFKSERMLILKSEDLFENTAMILKKITNFLNVESIPNRIQQAKENAGLGESNNVPEEIKNRLRKEFSQTMKVIEERYGIIWN